MPDPAATVADPSDFRLEVEHPRSGTVVISVYGDVDLHTADLLGERLVAAIDGRPSWLVVDLSGATFLDSQGLGALLRGSRRFDSGGGRLRLVVPRREIRRVFEMTSLDRIFPLDRTREDALASSSGEAAIEGA